jgi:hypothetical protein
MARTCVFCGGTGVTREHALPSWLGDVLRPDLHNPAQHRMRHRFGDHLREGGTEWRATDLAVVVRCVCRRCNNGWMAIQVEEPAKPLLTPMIVGNGVVLDARAQERVATWAVKTSSLLRLARPKPQSLPESVRRALHDQHTAPRECAVWLAGRARSDKPQVWGALSGFQLDLEGPSGPLSLETATVAIGHLVIQAVQCPYPGIEIDLELSDPLREFVVPIWPHPDRAVSWPPSKVMGGSREDMDDFAAAFRTLG